MKICIIKLGAKGDVVRTLPLLLGIKEKFPNSWITWITQSSSKEILETSSYINKILTIPISLNKLEKFDILYNFDIEEEATDLSRKINAEKKYGFYSENGFVSSYNLAGEYYLNTLFDDETKKVNKKTYQEMMFELAEIPYKKQYYQIFLSENDKKYAENYIKNNKLNKNTKKLIGIHVGAAGRWPSKKWHLDNLKEFIIKTKNKDYEILLFIGPDEKNYYDDLLKELNQEQIKIYSVSPTSEKEFFSLLNICSKVISGDSFALHSSLLLKKPTIGLFFCTPPDEVEGYGLLKKLISPRLYDFFPEKMDVYNDELTKSISADEVLNELENPNN